MLMKRFALAALLVGLVSAPAFADAVTYSGMRGDQKIIMELTEPKDGPLIGRYTDLAIGADIPLHPVSAAKYDVVLAEEAPCTPVLCVQADGSLVAEPPLGGQFQLHYSADMTRLTGTWRPSAPASANVQVNLTRIGRRHYNRQDNEFAYTYFLWDGGAAITPDTTPYDYAKMQVAQAEGPLQTMNGATYHDVTDPRTKFAFPRVVLLPGGADTAPVNAMLDQQRWTTSFSGFWCLAQDYLGGDWDEQRVGNGYSPLGDIDQEGISVAYLSATVMSITQGGSTYCGGASPYNHGDYYTYDVRQGRPLELNQIFKGWRTDTNAPTDELVDWVHKAYAADPDYDAAFDTDCEVSKNIAEHLGVSFAEGDVAVFFIGEIGQAACSGEFMRRPLAEIRDLLNDNAVEYFPSLQS